ncbi:MAG: bifunctional diaminohydroxyphosphoribosylaminopyrimidine deaminase/5-amino-6-(5-phosphoribosylamino)uracil reductase RibD [Chitinophagaceae bacterium]|nr:MAG: bifunctional diaminohydroxyphosphoribosylaminopyrimidine deaminase/5-amino-6-(5-phosphoribosylamino)uracil reductase RibD [Chitinophagaceae bacterium]
MTPTHETYMHRCLQLARLGAGSVAPNPMVGAVLVHEGRIIGEGFHRRYGGPHAEVHCIASVSEGDRHLIPESTLYVSLEPCAHFGKTPPCADLIVRERIPKVVVGCRDPFPSVNGKGIDKLHAAGIEVLCNVLEAECRELNRFFFTAHTRHRPWITLKWAQSADGFIAGANGRPVAISNAASARYVHRLRALHGAILVGTNTAFFDNPQLNTRHWPGSNPLRVVLDRQLRLPASLHLFNGEQTTLVLNELRTEQHHNLEYVRVDGMGGPQLFKRLGSILYSRGVHSLLVEGGAQLLQNFIDAGFWDEQLLITAPGLRLGKGIPAPLRSGGVLEGSDNLAGDRLDRYRNPANPY